MSDKLEDITAAPAPAPGSATAPILPYRPRDPKTFHPNIGVIGCGGITAHHLQAYANAGYSVVSLCDVIEQNARSRRDKYFPAADTTTNYRDLLARKDIEVVDIATHPAERERIIEDALNAGKHVLSQKPFVLDLTVGERLVALAAKNGVLLAVNQNGRWAPHLSYMRELVRANLLGDILGIHIRIDWDHTWIKGTVFESIEDVILYDFAIHWFDFVSSLIPGRNIIRVYASKSRAAGQSIKVPMLAQALVEFDGGQASLVFDAHTLYGQQDSTYIAGTAGSVYSTGPGLGEQTVQYFNKDGRAAVDLQGTWFSDGFHGTMGELLCAIEEGRSPLNNAKDNLRSLSLAFAAIASTNEKRPFAPGEAASIASGHGVKQ